MATANALIQGEGTCYLITVLLEVPGTKVRRKVADRFSEYHWCSLDSWYWSSQEPFVGPLTVEPKTSQMSDDLCLNLVGTTEGVLCVWSRLEQCSFLPLSGIIDAKMKEDDWGSLVSIAQELTMESQLTRVLM